MRFEGVESWTNSKKGEEEKDRLQGKKKGNSGRGSGGQPCNKAERGKTRVPIRKYREAYPAHLKKSAAGEKPRGGEV